MPAPLPLAEPVSAVVAPVVLVPAALPAAPVAADPPAVCAKTKVVDRTSAPAATVNNFDKFCIESSMIKPKGNLKRLPGLHTKRVGIFFLCARDEGSHEGNAADRQRYR